MNYRAIAPILTTTALTLIIGASYPIQHSHRIHLSAQAQSQTSRATMTLSALDEILRDEASGIEGGNGRWQLTMAGRPVVVLADVNNNRMRIVSPISAASELSAQQVQNILLANFHTALDARYAVSDGTVVALFVHPLASLTERDLRSGLAQVVTAADTFGTSYSSGDTGFGLAPQEAQRDRLSI